jgi:hypothetical protein
VPIAADTDARKLFVLRILVAVKPPVDDVQVGVFVAQEPKARHL